MTEFRVWAPRASRMTLQLDGMRHPMTARPGGWWSATGEGRDYGYVIDDAHVRLLLELSREHLRHGDEPEARP